MGLKDALSGTAVAIAVLCAVVSTGLLIRREIVRPGQPIDAVDTPVIIKNWREYAAVGHRMGSADAPVTILEFADFECPVCRKFTTGALRAIRREFGNRVSVVFRHWPLPYHRFAYPTARAAECAGDQGRFTEFHDAIYALQDSLGLRPFSSFARDAGVPDVAAFLACNSSHSPVAAIDVDAAAAIGIGGKGTPTVVINGMMLPGAPDSARLESLVRSALRNADPTPARR